MVLNNLSMHIAIAGYLGWKKFKSLYSPSNYLIIQIIKFMFYNSIGCDNLCFSWFLASQFEPVVATITV